MNAFALGKPDCRRVVDYSLLGPVLESIPALPRLRNLYMSYIPATEAQLVKLCRGVGTSRLKSIYLTGIEIVPGGSWRAVVEILKEKYDTMCRDGTQQVKLEIRAPIGAGVGTACIRSDDVLEPSHRRKCQEVAVVLL